MVYSEKYGNQRFVYNLWNRLREDSWLLSITSSLGPWTGANGLWICRGWGWWLGGKSKRESSYFPINLKDTKPWFNSMMSNPLFSFTRDVRKDKNVYALFFFIKIENSFVESQDRRCVFLQWKWPLPVVFSLLLAVEIFSLGKSMVKLQSVTLKKALWLKSRWEIWSLNKWAIFPLIFGGNKDISLEQTGKLITYFLDSPK